MKYIVKKTFDTKGKNLHVFVAFSVVGGNIRNMMNINTSKKLYLTVSTYFRFLDDNFRITLKDEYFLNKLMMYFNGKLFIFNIYNYKDGEFDEKNVDINFILRDNSEYKVYNKLFLGNYYLNYEEFFNLKMFKILFENKHFVGNAIFNFKDIEWKEIVLNFEKLGYVLTGGSNTKKHILSPVQNRLSNFISLLEGVDKSGLYESFHIIGNTSLSRKLEIKDDKEMMFIKDYKNELNEDFEKPFELKNFKKEYIEKGDLLITVAIGERYIVNRSDSKICTDLKIPKITNYEEVLKEKNKASFDLIKKFTGIDLDEYIWEIINIKDSNQNLLQKQKERCKFLNNNENFNSINNKNKVQNQIKKREYHTMIKKSNIINSLEKIEEMIDKNKDNVYLLQREIEESWLKMAEQNLENENKLLDSNKHRLLYVIENAKLTLDLMFKKKEIKRKFPLIHEDLNKIEFLLLTFSIVLANYNRLKYTSIAIRLGDMILFEIYRSKYNNNNKNEVVNKSFLDFKLELKFGIKESLKLGYFFINIFLQFPHNLFESKIESNSYYTSEGVELKINPKFLEEIKENIILHPSILPMFCRPNIWSDNLYGGLLMNSTQQFSIITGSTLHSHLTINKESLYKAINKLNSIKFRINTNLLEYLQNEGNYLLDSDNSEDELYKTIIIKLANIYKKMPFYLSVHADWRTRIYTQSFYLTYQGSDLSRSLIEFNKGEILTDKGKYYLYIYGANNHNENDISKQSFISRIEWVKKNYDKIINLDKELILKAENKFIFTAFCLNIRALHYNPNFIIRTPIFLDATCSGIQHLAAMIQDFELGIEVNLNSQTEEDKPKDIYTRIVKSINNELNKIGEEELEYNKLAFIKFDRKILKQSIMTKVYNVTNFGITQQIKSKLESIKILDDKENDNILRIQNLLIKNLKHKEKVYYLAPTIEGGQINLTQKDLYKIATVINNQIFVLFPSLNKIYSYFIEITKLMLKLELPMNWMTPTGVKFIQHYNKTTENLIAIRMFGKTNKIVLREKLNKINKVKQIQAIIPNIIHSLDATHLINIINNFENYKFNHLITIHDCFGTLPNHMEILNFLVKKEFILLYSQNKFLEKFHKRIIDTIKDNNIEIIYEKKKAIKVIINETEIKIPKVPSLGQLDFLKIKESKYMIS